MVMSEGVPNQTIAEWIVRIGMKVSSRVSVIHMLFQRGNKIETMTPQLHLMNNHLAIS